MAKRSRGFHGKFIDILTIILVSMVLVPLLVSLLGNLVGRSLAVRWLTGTESITVLAMLGQEVALFFLTLGVVFTSGYSMRHIGLHSGRWLRFVLLGVAAGLVLLLINSVGDIFSVWFFRLFFSAEQVSALLNQENAVLMHMLGREQPRWLVLSLLTLVGFVAPIVEEVFFRGYAYSVLREKIGVYGGMVASAILFASVHLYVIHFFPIFLLGLCLCFMYQRTNSLIPSIVAHSVMNLLVAWLIYGQASI